MGRTAFLACAEIKQTVWKRFAVSRSRFSVAGDGGFSFRR
jgi:hypothetical protein